MTKTDTRPPVQAMIAFTDDHRRAYGVEPICKLLPIVPSTYYEHVAKQANRERRSERARRDEALEADIGRVFATPASSSMPWNRRFTTDARCVAAGSSIIATGAARADSTGHRDDTVHDTAHCSSLHLMR